MTIHLPTHARGSFCALYTSGGVNIACCRLPGRSMPAWRFATAMMTSVLLLGTMLSHSNAQSPQSSAHLYFFTNKGCAPCRHVEPAIEELKRAGYDVSTIQLDQRPDLGQRFNVDRTPTVIMVAQNKIVGRHAGLIDAATLRDWFRAVENSSPSTTPFSENRSPRINEPIPKPQTQTDSKNLPYLGAYTEVPETSSPESRPPSGSSEFPGTPTMHHGTSEPRNAIEKRAMDATVRLKVQDKQGVSYATGTVVHSHEGEWLVMTCGHAFRETGFNGKISAEYNFGNGQVDSAPGELISFDAQARDVALVAIQAGRNIQAVNIANEMAPVERGETVFSIGCDNGSDPTIRHSKIKSKAIYDGAVKYDIYGRPAIGRSGGGLFNGAGELIGVCNAAAVETDEGIYSAIDSLYWQLSQANLDHLFVSTDSAVQNPSGRSVSHTEPCGSESPEGFQRVPRLPARQAIGSNRKQENQDSLPQVSLLNASIPGDRRASEMDNHEVVIIVRSKTSQKVTGSLTIENPTSQLLDYLAEMKSASDVQRGSEAGSSRQTASR